MHSSVRLVDGLRRYADGATFADVGAPDGIGGVAARASILRLIGRLRRLAALYGDRDSASAMNGPVGRDAARAAVTFLEDKEPRLRRKFQATRAAKAAARREEREAAFEHSLGDLEATK